MKPCFSIITISYNQAQFLEKCILSVLDQNEPIEHIIIDGGSTDGSLDILKKYGDRIAFWISEKDTGPANALNKGLRKVSGDFVGYINSDDYLLPEAISNLKSIIQRHEGYDVYFGPGYIKDERKGTMKLIHPTKWSLGTYRTGVNIMMQQSIFISQKMFKLGLQFNETNTMQWDGELLVDLDLAGASFYLHNIPLSVFRIHTASITGGVLGENGAKNYKLDIERVNTKIDLSGKIKIKNKGYWYLWLTFFDFRNMVHRIMYKIFHK